MTKSAVSDWDTTAGNNTDVGGVNVDEGCPAPNLNNAIREMMAQVATFISAADFSWLAVPIGGIALCDPAKGDFPPTDSALYRFAELTSGLDGSGEYNEGILTGESITGSGDTLVATAVVDLDGSPYDGETINLINTEGRVIYTGETAGSVWNDQMQAITGTLTQSTNRRVMSNSDGAFTFDGVTEGVLGSPGTPTGSADGKTITFNSANSPSARTGTGTRAKGITMVAYRRLK